MSDSLDAPLQAPRRSATLPAKLQPRRQPSSDSLRSQGVLYYHPSAKIVHFSPRALAPIPSSTAPSDFDYPVDTIETLPWRSPTERTVALGPLRLESLHGLTVFLKCGGVVRPILKNSQCWCVDGESTFVLRIRPLTYYRIEIPNESAEDKESVGELKGALPGILRYEVTPCPFKRGFTVEIPEESKTRTRKRAWRPKPKRESAPACLAGATDSNTSEDGSSDSPDGDDGNAIGDGPSRTNGRVLETIPDDNEPSEPVPVVRETGIHRRSVSETQSFHNLLARFEPNSEPHVDDASFSSAESFHSARPSSPLLPPSSSHSTSTAPTSVGYTGESQFCESPIQSVAASEVISETQHGHHGTTLEASPDLSEPSKPFLHVLPDAMSAQPPKTLNSDSLSDMSTQFRRRTKASREREVSPMPPPSTLCQPSPEPSQDSPGSIIQKTCTLVLVPPIQLLLILIHIAARIVIGSALHSALGEGSKVGGVDDNDAVDDFDFGIPLEVNPSNEGHQSQRAKSDPWDLD